MPDMRTYPQKARERISASKIINRLVKHIHGEIDMSPSQVQAARILLNKVLPDLKSVEVAASVEVGPPVYEMTDEQLLAIAAGALNVVPIQKNEKTVVEVQTIEPAAKKKMV